MRKGAETRKMRLPPRLFRIREEAATVDHRKRQNQEIWDTTESCEFDESGLKKLKCCGVEYSHD